jgi:5-methyltetrahydropteroyltriglutamate--homocysteine methyltransferase
MNRSIDRFLTTHTGSLPRPDDLIRTMFAKEEGVPVDPAALAQRVALAVEEVVGKQAQAGVDVIDDGEMSKPSYATYIKDRLAGFGGEGNTFVYQDLADFPKLAKRVFGDPGRSRRKTPACNAPIGVRDPGAVVADVEHLKAAVAKVKVEGAFMTAALLYAGAALVGALEFCLGEHLPRLIDKLLGSVKIEVMDRKVHCLASFGW